MARCLMCSSSVMHSFVATISASHELSDFEGGAVRDGVAKLAPPASVREGARLDSARGRDVDYKRQGMIIFWGIGNGIDGNTGAIRGHMGNLFEPIDREAMSGVFGEGGLREENG
eukprot:scaffold5753_cov56-Cyclotella_meneghiniana.AAC.2